MPLAFRASTWSFIRAMRGETTMQVPSETTAGIWKHTDLPPPVGMSTTVSFPSSTCWMISPCMGRKLS